LGAFSDVPESPWAGIALANVLDRARKSENERQAPIDPMVGSTLGLLAFVLAFTFGNFGEAQHDCNATGVLRSDHPDRRS